MNRIEARMDALKKEGKKAFITYITAGLPNMEGTKRILKAQYEAGIDVVELGVPFSDPVADGPVIQNASYKAILKGVNLVKCFKMVEKLREECQVPLVFMMYYNTILHYGIDEFAKECNRVGVDGVIIPDLPYEEQDELRTALKNAGDEGAKRDSIYEYLRDVLPSNKTEEQQLRMVGKLLVEMDDNKLITPKGRKWIIRP